jgi:hypothetical protein
MSVSLVVLRNFCRYLIGMTYKACRATFFCLGIGKPLSLRSGLPLPYMLGLIVFSFPLIHVDFLFIYLFYFFISDFLIQKILLERLFMC